MPREPSAPGRPVIGISLGDPGGIGPEVIVKALSAGPDNELRRRARFAIFGAAGPLERAAAAAGVEPFWSRDPGAGVRLVPVAEPGECPPRPARGSGDFSFRCVEAAIEAAARRADHPDRVDAVVTGPISKEAWALAGHGRYPGHTELFTERFASDRSAMMFVTPRLRVILATTHLPLMRVRDALTTPGILQTIELGDEACRRLGVELPRIAVCGLNPHAGEGGLLGDEDSLIIAPAIAAARGRRIDASGPHPADTIFNAAVDAPGAPRRYDLVVAMYHDQGLIPVKLLDRDRAVNVTVGLPIVRTSPDHGTAFDIAGLNRAEAGSMKSAIDLAIRILGGPLAPRAD